MPRKPMDTRPARERRPAVMRLLRDAAFAHADYLELCEASITATRRGDAGTGANLYAEALDAKARADALLAEHDLARSPYTRIGKRIRTARFSDVAERAGTTSARLGTPRRRTPA